jgi:hypothetical protein
MLAGAFRRMSASRIATRGWVIRKPADFKRAHAKSIGEADRENSFPLPSGWLDGDEAIIYSRSIYGQWSPMQQYVCHLQLERTCRDFCDRCNPNRKPPLFNINWHPDHLFRSEQEETGGHGWHALASVAIDRNHPFKRLVMQSLVSY